MTKHNTVRGTPGFHQNHNTVRGTPFTSRTHADNPGFRRQPMAPKREVRSEKLGEKGFRQIKETAEDAMRDKLKHGGPLKSPVSGAQQRTGAR